MRSNFFSSLERVEKRLKLDRPRRRQTPQTTASSPLDHSPASPLHLLSSLPYHHHHHHHQALDPPPPPPPPLQDSSEAPEAFLSCSPQFHSPPESPPPPATEIDADSADDIDRLMRMLGLGNREPKSRGGGGAGCGDAGACECEGGFYERIAGVKGPKCPKEAERLDRWIECFLNGRGGGDGDERVEPLRLVHLLLGKAASVCEGGGCGSEIVMKEARDKQLDSLM
ncbi:forkhead box protein G1-like [Rhodamnia argentea]|uniref:Forkhead box protein G1-like n=1 Tax=Rhodamnia argentea TaxID=178133 RepID=A0A8B8NAW6_9MYRT|nr:forkhead box protein G1-like [Rhodamnia argentea]